MNPQMDRIYETLHPQFSEIALILKFCSQHYHNLEIQALFPTLSLTLKQPGNRLLTRYDKVF